MNRFLILSTVYILAGFAAVSAATHHLENNIAPKVYERARYL